MLPAQRKKWVSTEIFQLRIIIQYVRGHFSTEKIIYHQLSLFLLLEFGPHGVKFLLQFSGAEFIHVQFHGVFDIL